MANRNRLCCQLEVYKKGRYTRYCREKPSSSALLKGQYGEFWAARAFPRFLSVVEQGQLFLEPATDTDRRNPPRQSRGVIRLQKCTAQCRFTFRRR